MWKNDEEKKKVSFIDLTIYLGHSYHSACMPSTHKESFIVITYLLALDISYTITNRRQDETSRNDKSEQKHERFDIFKFKEKPSCGSTHWPDQQKLH